MKRSSISLNCIPFIKTKVSGFDPKWDEIIRDEGYPVWIFTSKNAVQFIKNSQEYAEIGTRKIILSVGEKTSTKLQKLNLNPKIGNAENASALIEEMKIEKIRGPFLYFCSDQRLDKLPNYLASHKLPFKEIHCYKTSLCPTNINQDNYDIICFASPSAVNSFFSKNKVQKCIIYIAIGETSLHALKNHCKNAVKSEESTLLSLIEKGAEILSSEIDSRK